MTKLIGLRQRLANEQRGIAMIVTLGVLLVASILIAVMFQTVLREQTATGRQRNITNGRQAAEAAVDQMVYELGQGSNWTGYTTTYPTGCVNNCYSGTIGSGNSMGSYRGSVAADGNNFRVITMRGQFPANRGPIRTLRVRVSKVPPQALQYAMFASRGIDIHHHSASYLSPQVVTTAVHSNGYMKIDYSSEFTVKDLEVVGALTFQSGGGQYPLGAIPGDGYSWYDQLNHLCYPGNFPFSTQGVSNWTGTPPTNVTCPNKYAGNVVITGNISAGSVKQGTRGIVKAGPDITLQTGVSLGSRGGDILAGRYQGPTGNPLLTANAVCSNCHKFDTVNNVSKAGPGEVDGDIKIQPGYAPPTIPFPNVDYPGIRASAAAQIVPGSSPTQSHVFANCTDFMNYAYKDTANFRTVPTGLDKTLQTWHFGDGMPDAIVLTGDWYIDSGGCNFSWSTAQTTTAKWACNNANVRFCGGTGVPAANAPAPMLIIAGNFVIPNGSASLQAPLAVVGSDTPLNFVVRADASTNPPTPISVNETNMLAGGVMPGMIAAGGGIDSHDFSSDSKWTVNNTYRWWQASPVYIRGIAYSAAYVNATTMTPANQHFHNDDPRNPIKVFGSQVGGTLHNCMNFTFMYDPVVLNAPWVKAPGTVKIVDYQELNPSASL